MLFRSMVSHPRPFQTLAVEFDHTKRAMRSRRMRRGVFYDLDAQRERIVRDGFPMNSTMLPDCWFILWPGHAVQMQAQQTFARRWYYEVAHFSMREQTNFNWIVSMVPELTWLRLHRNYAGAALARDFLTVDNSSVASSDTGCACNVKKVACPNERMQAGVCSVPPRTLCPPPCVSDTEPSYLVSRIGAADTAGFQFKPPTPRCSDRRQEAHLTAEVCCRKRLERRPVFPHWCSAPADH